jgi:hypothetical protein
MRFRWSIKKGDFTRAVLIILGCVMLAAAPVQAGTIDVFHADSLASRQPSKPGIRGLW